MDENQKNQVELEVRRLLDNEELKLSRQMSEQVDKHRAFLQTQFNRMTWGIGILLLIATGTFGWLFGKSYDSTQKKIIQEVEQKIIEYRIVDTFKRRLDEQIILAATKPDVIENIGQQVRDVVSEQVTEKTDKIITERLIQEIERISEKDLKELVDIAVKDSLGELKEIKKELDAINKRQRAIFERTKFIFPVELEKNLPEYRQILPPQWDIPEG